MLIKSIELMHEITDINCDNVDVCITAEHGYTYTIVVGTPPDLLEQMNQDKKFG